ncbi:MAG: S41 family peptidase, partial [Cyclobacteriaceae bacterium]
MEDESTHSPAVNYEFLYNEVKAYYPYLEYKNIPWENLDATWRTQLGEEMSDEELFDLFSQMLHELKDGHVMLQSHNQTYHYFIPGASNFDLNLVRQNYLQNSAGYYQQNGAFSYGILPSGIGYIYYPSFESRISRIDYILDYFRANEVNAIILDIRNNSGGSTANVTGLAAKFTEKRFHGGYTIFKRGEN